MRAERSFLDDAGQILAAYLAGRNEGAAAHLIERWSNALFWFGEARRESSDFMAVVDYGCAADGLSGAGGKIGKITKFAEAALNPKGAITPTGILSVKEAVQRVYGEGRNKLAHGEKYGLLEDHHETRTIGDNLLTALLNEITPEIAKIIATRTQILDISEDHAFKALVTRLSNRP